VFDMLRTTAGAVSKVNYFHQDLSQVCHEDAVNRLKSNKVNLGTGRVCTTFLIKMEAIGQSDSQLIQ
jgi:hypothetical protein